MPVVVQLKGNPPGRNLPHRDTAPFALIPSALLCSCRRDRPDHKVPAPQASIPAYLQYEKNKLSCG